MLIPLLRTCWVLITTLRGTTGRLVNSPNYKAWVPWKRRTLAGDHTRRRPSASGDIRTVWEEDLTDETRCNPILDERSWDEPHSARRQCIISRRNSGFWAGYRISDLVETVDSGPAFAVWSSVDRVCGNVVLFMGTKCTPFLRLGSW